MKYTLLILAIITLFILCYCCSTFTETFSSDCVNDCVKSHSQNAINYVWLNKLNHGKVLKVEFEEPANSNKWTLYDDHWWQVHCDVLDHNPDNLVESHYKAFVHPQTRFARLRFTFQDGSVLEPTKQFYELEAEYFKNHNHCK